MSIKKSRDDVIIKAAQTLLADHDVRTHKTRMESAQEKLDNAEDAIGKKFQNREHVKPSEDRQILSLRKRLESETEAYDKIKEEKIKTIQETFKLSPEEKDMVLKLSNLKDTSIESFENFLNPLSVEKMIRDILEPPAQLIIPEPTSLISAQLGNFTPPNVNVAAKREFESILDCSM